MSIDAMGIGAVADFASNLVNRFFPDKSEAQKAEMAQAMILLQGTLDQARAQIEVNKVEAANPSVFVSGWRPAVGWVCVSGCAWNWVGLPVTNAICQMVHNPLALAPANISEMMPLLLGMLGLGAIRMAEKIKGVAAQ